MTFEEADYLYWKQFGEHYNIQLTGQLTQEEMINDIISCIGNSTRQKQLPEPEDGIRY